MHGLCLSLICNLREPIEHQRETEYGSNSQHLHFPLYSFSTYGQKCSHRTETLQIYRSISAAAHPHQIVLILVQIWCCGFSVQILWIEYSKKIKIKYNRGKLSFAVFVTPVSNVHLFLLCWYQMWQIYHIVEFGTFYLNTFSPFEYMCHSIWARLDTKNVWT